MKRLLNYLGTNSDSFRIFLIVTLSTCIYWFSGIKSVIYEPFRAALGVSNAQLGFLLGMLGFIQIFGYLLFGWLQDLLSIRKIIAVDLCGYGILALILGVVPNLPYWFLIVAFAGFGFFGDALYWPTIQKCTKSLAAKEKQAAIFSTQEAIRAAIGFVLSWITLGLFILGGSNVFGARLSMSAYAVFMILFSLVVLRFIPKDFLHAKDGKTRVLEPKSKNGFNMILAVCKLPIVWTTGIGAASTYIVYVASNTYFLPFIQSTFALSDQQAALFGIVNSGLVGLIAAGLSGMFATMRFTTTPQWMLVLFMLLSVFSGAIIVAPRASRWLIPVIVLALLVTFICVALRAVYYAPVGEYGVPDDISATAMSVASFIGYCPSFFAYPLFGWILDSNNTQTAYRIIFIILIGASLVGFISCLIAHLSIMRKRRRELHHNKQAAQQ